MDFEHSVESFHAAIHESGNIYFNYLISALGHYERHEELLNILMDKIPVDEVYHFAWLDERDGVQQLVTKGQGWFDDRTVFEAEAFRFTPWLDYAEEACHPVVLQMMESQCKCCWIVYNLNCACYCHKTFCTLQTPVPRLTEPVDVATYSTLYRSQHKITKLPWKAGINPELYVYCLRPGDRWFYSTLADKREASCEYREIETVAG